MRGQPIRVQGLTVGLLGGSFDPPHEGHVHITKQALKVFSLSKLWWLVSPGNPIKKTLPSDLNKRYKASKIIMNHPSVTVTNLECKLNTQFTAETLYKIKKLYPGIKFVWLMGADNLVNFHRWNNWDWIMKNIPIGVLSRPEEQIRAGLSCAATRFRKFRLPKERSFLLPYFRPPVWTLIIGPMINISSTNLRRENILQ